MILFWDKNTPKTIPEALLTLNLPVGIEYYLKHFPLSDRYPEGGDDSWLSLVGRWGWIVIAQDYRLHRKPAELYALKQYSIGCFYLWGAEAPKWEIFRCFARGYDRIIEAANTAPRPFIFRVTQKGSLIPLPIPIP